MAVSAKKREKRNVPVGIVYINATFNNTIITVTDMNGNVIAYSSAGQHGFKGSRKATPFAGQVTAEAAINSATQFGLKTVEVRAKGPGSGRESALRAITAQGLIVNVIKDITPVPHNGCRPRKRRRV